VTTVPTKTTVVTTSIPATTLTVTPSSVTTITSTVTSTVTTVTTGVGGALLILLVLTLAAYLFLPSSLVIRLRKQVTKHYDPTPSLPRGGGSEFEEPEV
jgi:beta-lactamase regulating signal transducer with metallopeptidase domain